MEKCDHSFCLKLKLESNHRDFQVSSFSSDEVWIQLLVLLPNGVLCPNICVIIMFPWFMPKEEASSSFSFSFFLFLLSAGSLKKDKPPIVIARKNSNNYKSKQKKLTRPFTLKVPPIPSKKNWNYSMRRGITNHYTNKLSFQIIQKESHSLPSYSQGF